MANDQLLEQLKDSLFQLTKVYEGADPSFYDVKITEQAFTPRETLVHLAEAAHACVKGFAGEKHEWGTYTLEDQSPEGLWKVFNEVRAEAIAAIEGASPEQAMALGFHFLLAHEYYHVGQLALARLQNQPDWDAYSIYSFGA